MALPLDKDIIHKELDLIQGIVSRMAANSFQVKAWTIGILSALVAFEKEGLFAQASTDPGMSIKMNIFLFLPIFCFWYLDAFFLSTERLYRELYKWVVQYRPKTDAYLYDLNTFTRTVGEEKVEMLKEQNSLWNVMFSKTLWPFYVMPLTFVVALLFYNLFRG